MAKKATAKAEQAHTTAKSEEAAMSPPPLDGAARAAAETFPCKDCGEQLTYQNRSILKDGSAVHIGCKKRKRRLFITDVEEPHERKAVLSGLPAHKGVKPPRRPKPPPPSEHGDFMPCADFSGRTCIQLERGVNTVVYVTFDPAGLHLSYMDVGRFDERYKPLRDYPALKSAEAYKAYAMDHGATQDVVDRIGRVAPFTQEEADMAKKKLAARTSELASKPKHSKSDKAKGPRQPGERKPSAASLFKELIMAGKLTDDRIFAEVQKKFGLDDSKRGYVAWYRNHLKKEGKNPPEAKAA